MDDLKKLISLCKCSVELSVNEHRDYYQSILENIPDEDKEEIDYKVLDEMIKRDSLVKIHFYPNTPNGFFVVYHYDLDGAINECLSLLNRITER